MSVSISRNQYWSIDDIAFIEYELLAILPDDYSRGYVSDSIAAAKHGNMKKWRLNRIVWHQLHDVCQDMFDSLPLPVMETYKQRKEYYIHNNGEDYYENKIRDTIDWRGRNVHLH